MKLNKQLKETRMQNGIDISEPKVRQVGNLIDDTDRGFDNPQTGRVYDTNGLCPTINTMQGGDREPKILSYTRDDKGKITNYHVKDEANTIHSSTGGGGNTSQYVIQGPVLQKVGIASQNDNSQGGSVYSAEGIAPTLCAGTHGYAMGNIVEPIIAAMRGCNPDTPSDRSKGIYCEQRIEVGGEVSNTLTSAQKDNLLIEPQIITPLDRNPQKPKDHCCTLRSEAHGNVPCVMDKGALINDGDGLYLQTTDAFNRGGLPNVSRTLKANMHDAGVCNDFRIRKLTERECFRLMGVSETDIDKIQHSGVSRSQQYKMAGNSIVVDVLYHIFRKLFTETQCEEEQLKLF